MAVTTIERIDTDRIARAAGKRPQRVRERVSVAPPLHLVGRLRPNLRAVHIDGVPGDIVVAQGRPRDRDARAVRRRDLDRADSIGSSPARLGRTCSQADLTSNRERGDDRHKSGG